MSLLDEAKLALIDAGTVLKKDLWKKGDEKFLAARAKDLVGLHKKADATKDKKKKAAYVAAAKDVLHHVTLLAMIRMEVAKQHVIDALSKFFMDKLVPALIKVLPALIGL